MGYDLFQSENDLIARFEDSLGQDDATDGIPAEELEILLKGYKKLFKRTRQLVRLNDHNEEDLRKAKTRAEAATKAKADFLAAMSHEIRTPMNGVVGMIDLLRETSLDADQKQMMRTVRDSAFSLLQIINDILDSSKIEAGKMELELLPIYIGDIVEGVAETLLPNANVKSVSLITYVDPAIPHHVMADQVRIRQILFNLGGNAIKFTENTPDRPGRVLIRAVHMPGWRDGVDAIRLSVTDSGIGMSESAQENLFKPFTQADATTTRRFGGTGLGLSICKNLTSIMQGVIEVESEEGVGSTFSVTLPLEAASEQSEDDAFPDLSGLRVLLVVEPEDEGEFLRDYIDDAGAGVVVKPLEEAEETLNRLSEESKPVDAIVFDCQWSGEAIERVTGGLAGDQVARVILSEDRKARKGMIAPGIVVVETRPLRRASFIRGIALAVGRLSSETETKDLKPAKRHVEAPDVETARAMGQLILVAEDNVTNQDVIRRQLNRLGYACKVASDGREAFDAWKNSPYAVLLTDCHMPEMDGYELTAAIRAEEGGDERLPVIAITANALQGEDERCLAAGMDGYLTKPLEMDKLKDVLSRWMPQTTRETDLPSEAPGPDETPDAAPGYAVLDLAPLKDMVGDDPDVIKEILGDFIAPSQEIVDEIGAAFKSRVAEDIGRAAHKLKSSSRAVGANALADLCLEMETSGKSGDWSGIDAAFPKLAGLMQQVVSSIHEL